MVFNGCPKLNAETSAQSYVGTGREPEKVAVWN